MARITNSRVAELFARRKRHETYLLVLRCLAVFVVVGVSLALMRMGVAATHDEPPYEAAEETTAELHPLV